MSSVGRVCGSILAKDVMLSVSLTSRGRILMVGFLDWMVGSARRVCIQAWPLVSLRTARMRVVRFRARSCRAVSRPRPALAPVITADWPSRLMSEGRGVTLGWKNGMLEGYLWWIEGIACWKGVCGGFDILVKHGFEHGFVERFI